MPWRVWVVWALFLVRGSFYCAAMPLWEGWDEYAHFAWLQHWLDEGTIPGFHDPVSREIDESMRLTPLAHELKWIGPPYLTHSQWWRLPAGERAARLRELANLPPEFARQPALHRFEFYEAQQPPLYYWLLSLPLRLAGTWHLNARVLLIRLLSMALASLAIPFAWLAGRALLGSGPAFLCTALLAIAPGFAIDVSRVANDSLAIALVAMLFWLLVRGAFPWLWVGLTLGAGLLAKAYLLALVPALIVLWWRRKRELALALGVVCAVVGWWYVRNLLLGRSFSGWLLHPDAAGMLAGVFRINWFSAAHVIAKSFLWFGGWSFLTLKSWIYAVVESTGLVGLGLAIGRRPGQVRIPAILLGLYLAGMAYGVLVFFATQNVPNLPGWYLWPLGGAIALLLVAGLQRFSVLLIAALAALDLYGAAALLIPYYAGLAERNHAAATHFGEALARLGIPVWLAAAWVLATLAIVALTAMADYEGER